MKLQEVGITLYLNSTECDQYTVEIDVPNKFENWSEEMQIEYLENHMDRIEKEVRERIIIRLSDLHPVI